MPFFCFPPALAVRGTVTISGGTVTNSVYGGYSTGNSSNNVVTITGGTVNVDGASNKNITGGYSASGTANNNTMHITGGAVNGIISGGMTNTATGNTVILAGTATFGAATELWGGIGSGDVRSGNTLEMHLTGVEVVKLGNFQHYKFFLPSTIAANDTVLKVTSAVDISTPTGKAATTVGVGIMGGGSSLKRNDTITLIHATGGLTADSNMPNTTTGMAGISKVYEFTLETTEKDLLARVSSASDSDEGIRKSPAEGRGASVAIVTQGADMVAGQGMNNARLAARSASASPSGLGMAAFGAVSGGASTYNIGSHVDVSSFSAMAGLAKRLPFGENGSKEALLGAFFETGFGSYTSHDVHVMGDPVTFEAVNSHRIRLGGRFSYAVSEQFSPYIGAAWSHEFDGKVRSVVANVDAPTPSVTGSTGVGDLGLTWKPSADSALSVDLGVQGYVGMRQGVYGNLQLKLEF